ncbi:putative protease [Methanomicrobium sp. W14]|uniref:DUF3656 domain-containing U32 family peptidase n=1 Tax=Methanomicrobium sp. W14 TaxID=2817839 RepID=UPI001AE23822|nr:U32 family peptidase [Methanomicrobium sp. W14]MBP2133908.1 putative protease [Methanomicrobium sp. W14]
MKNRQNNATRNSEDLKIPELLAPVGSKEALSAAVAAGADAVYLSGRKFGARKFAENFDEEGIIEAIDYCHKRGVKVYITLNTLISDAEMADALNEMYFYYAAGADAVLVQDMGLVKASGECIPKLTLHASTQMTINNTPGVVLACRMNLKRVVLSRELSSSGINRIYRDSGICRPELEVFVHGALCFCYSGQCLLSSLIGGRSGNRGMCAQPCRKKYSLVYGKSGSYGKVSSYDNIVSRGLYLMSPKDLCEYDNPGILGNPNISSLKIEGRMKSAGYVAVVVSVYRKALDEISAKRFTPARKDLQNLLFAFNRGFTGGFLADKKGMSMMSVKRPGNLGVYVGEITSCDLRTGNTVIKIKGEVVPEVGDGLTIRSRSSGRDNGLTLRPPFSCKNMHLSFRISYPVYAGDKVYITKRKSVELLAETVAGSEGGVYKKIPVEVNISLDGNRLVVKGRVKIYGHWHEVFCSASFEMEKARKRPVLKDDLKKIFEKTGGTQFFLSSFNIEYGENLFSPLGLLNELRRDFYASVEKKAVDILRPSVEDSERAASNVKSFVAGLKKYGNRPAKEVFLSFYAGNTESVRGAVCGGCKRVYFEPDIVISRENSTNVLIDLLKSAAEICEKDRVLLFWKWPRITDDSYIEFGLDVLGKLPCGLIAGVMAESFGAAYVIKQKFPGITVYGSAGLNIFNSLAAVSASSLFEGVTLSQELSYEGVRELLGRIPDDSGIETELIVQGEVEVMVTEHNLVCNTLDAMKKSSKEPFGDGVSFALRDEIGQFFPVYTDMQGRTHIYNSRETCLADSMNEILSCGLSYVAIDGRRKDFDYAEVTVKSYLEILDAVKSRDKGLKEITERIKSDLMKISSGGITKGHYSRGV